MKQVITTYQSHSGYYKHKAHLYGNTPYGDYLRMKEDFLLQEVEMLLDGFKSIGVHFIPKSEKTKKRLIQVLFNTNFLKKQQEQCGSLTCVFCGKPNLVIYNCDAKNVNKNIMATADHFFPKARGGKAFNEDNLVVACSKCNNNKGKKIYKLDTLKYLSFYGNEKILLEKLAKQIIK